MKIQSARHAKTIAACNYANLSFVNRLVIPIRENSGIDNKLSVPTLVLSITCNEKLQAETAL